MRARTSADASWRHSNSITHHMDHPPRVKALVDDLYAQLSQRGRRDYEAMIEAEYTTPDERVTHTRCGDGLLSTIVRPMRGDRSPRLTHLVYGGCTAHQIRQDLVARGLGSLPITWVYPPETIMTSDED
ncbi:hypothetical protein [Amycolatopsis sp. NPDC059657]|uniref:hypothetical protein n=1 Tax=Amycolatopsis sp. NPDC059657 TaxID=3346899 RepID=UPI00367345B4